MKGEQGASGEYAAAIEAARHYSAATGIPCTVIDPRGEVQGKAESFHACAICRQMYGPEEGEELCRKTHLYGSYQSERFGGRYHYFCAASLNFWASPIMMDGAMRGALVAGPVLLLDRDELLTEILRRRAGTLRSERAVPRPPSTAELRRILGSIGKIDPARAHSLAELLFYTASSLSDESTLILTRRHQACEQQSRIGEYIQRVKEEGDTGPANGYPLSKERELQSYIARGDKKNAQALLNEILGSVFFSAGRNPEVVKARVMELVVLLSRAALEGGADTEQIFGLNHTYLSQVSGFRSIDDIAYWLSEIMERFTDLVFDLKEIKHTDAMYKAISYIHRHHGERISLEDVAAQVRLSPAYFSKVFRREAGCTFRSYLNRVRIEKSKILLRDGGMQLAEVAGLAGYEDQSYFTKVFKKFVGVSPGKYREAWNYFPTDTQEIHPDGVEK